jgi:hypothetical protein
LFHCFTATLDLSRPSDQFIGTNIYLLNFFKPKLQGDAMNSDVRSLVLQLSHLMKDKRRAVDADLVRTAKKCLSIFHDKNFGSTIPGYRTLMEALYLEAADDLANGAPLLKSYSMGLSFKNGKLTKFSIPYSDSTSFGTIACSIKIKSLKAFEKHLANQDFNLSQEQINASIYFISLQLAQL